MREIKFKFEDLKVYQKALNFIDNTYSSTKKFPKNEDYALSSQFKRASISIALNIVEGSGDTNAKRLNYLSNEDDYKNRLQLEELSKMTASLQKYLKSNDNNPKD